MGVRGFWVLGKSANTNIYMFLLFIGLASRVGLGGHPQTFSAIDLCRRNDAESVKLISRISKRDAFRSAKKERENAEMGTIAIASPKSQSVN